MSNDLPAYPGPDPEPERWESQPSVGQTPPPPPPGQPTWPDTPSWSAPPHSGTMAQPGQHPYPFAHWGHRVLARIIDTVLLTMIFAAIGFAVGFLVYAMADVSSSGDMTSTDEDMLATTLGFVVQIGAVLLQILYYGVFQGITGWTVGKKAVGIRVYETGNAKPVGAGMSIVRYFAHILDGLACLIGYLWPLWDVERRTFADMLCNQRVYKIS